MSEASKTVAFVVTAGILGVAAAFTWFQTTPADVAGFEKVGEEFFPEFLDATKATSLEVTAYDEETDGLREFSVQFENGLWRIPSHHGYPAEAADRLARTATSLIGLERESIVARRNNKHGEFGVLDPSDNDADPETAGQRITLKNEAGDVLADYIIGKPAGRAAEENPGMVREVRQQDDYYYVRVPDEKETYKAKVQIDLSTRFSDWINPDLLKLEAADVNRLEIDNYELTKQNVTVGNNRVQPQFAKKVIDRQKLTRNGFAPWELDGLNTDTEELETLKVEEILTLLDSMKIVGVRPKLKLNGELLVKSDLSVNEELARKNPQMFQRRVFQLQEDLERKGFTIGAAENDPATLTLLGSRGELRAATNEGVLYTLYFGRSVSGDQKEIEIGAAVDSSDADSESGSDENAEAETTETADGKSGESEGQESSSESGGENESGSEEQQPVKNKSRYVAIRVDFDVTAVGDTPVEPTEPTKPEMPEGYEAWKEVREEKLKDLGNDVPPEQRDGETKESEQNDEARDESANQNQDQSSDDNQDDSPEAPADIEAANDEEFLKYEISLADYDKAVIQYTTDLEMYASEKTAFETKEKNGRELVEELNERFAEWFYVIPAESLESLKLTRGDLVNVKETPPPNLNAPPSPGDVGKPGNQLPDAPNIKFDSEKEEEEKPDVMPDAKEDGSADEEKAESKAAEGDQKADKGEGWMPPPSSYWMWHARKFANAIQIIGLTLPAGS